MLNGINDLAGSVQGHSAECRILRKLVCEWEEEGSKAGALKEAYEDLNTCLNIASFRCPYFPFMVENANVFTSIIL